MGERAILAEVGSVTEVLSLHAALEATRPAGIVDLVPAARTILVAIDPSVLPLSAARRWLGRTGSALGASASPDSPPAIEAQPSPTVEISVCYDGIDLGETADLLGIGVADLVARHRAAGWTVAFTGFAPGFAYLVSEDWPFEVPRLAVPRTRVPAGAVALAGPYCGAYPRETPGGWRLIGTTRATLFDPGAEAPALLAPRTRVRFVEESA